MTDFLFALALMLLGKNGAVVPLRPAPTHVPLTLAPEHLKALPYTLASRDFGPVG